MGALTPTEGVKRGLRTSATLVLLLLLAVVAPRTYAGSRYVDPLDKHSVDLAGKLMNYGDVIPLRDLKVLTGNLSRVAEAGVLSFSKLYELGRILSRVVEKLESVNREVALSLKSFLGIANEGELRIVAEKASSIVPGNSTNPVATLNQLYSRGDIGAVDYLLLLGYYVRELRIDYLEDAETVVNVRRALSEVNALLSRQTGGMDGVVGSLGGGYGTLSIFRGLPTLTTSAIALLLVVVSVPVVATSLLELWIGRRGRVRVLRSLAYVDVGLITVSPPDDVVKALWLAVGALSKVEPWRPWETPREYLAKVTQRGIPGRVVEALRRLTEEYERVRYGGYSPSLSPRELVELLSTVEEAVGPRSTLR
ncbi:MAG: DUF4129 domain-containing protein [Desulfurococcaceae archaeon]|jgi:hypothetical protein|nr:DUF4129 domain-containing protein [Desulfurococcaceae archaeon]